MAPDPWFSTYDSTCQIAQEIAEKIQQQNQYERNGENTIRLTVTIRTLLQNLKEKIAFLKDLLLNAVSTHQITQLEGDQRQNLLDELITRERLLVASFKNEDSSIDGHLGCFHSLAIINNVAINIRVNVSFQISVFIFFG
uniref:Syntaxin-8 n=2 Tax=Canis lupus familiaris TaxID=9615 RepID=A0A8C0SG64_CANLF